jgi:hypothetical protein
MTPKEERFWDVMSKIVGNGMLGLVVVALIVCGVATHVQWPARITGPHVIRGAFLTSTIPVNTIGGYPFLGEDGRKYYISCKRAVPVRGKTYTWCLNPARGPQVPDLLGRPVEVRYLLIHPVWSSDPPEMVLLSVRDGEEVLAVNSTELKASEPSWGPARR